PAAMPTIGAFGLLALAGKEYGPFAAKVRLAGLNMSTWPVEYSLNQRLPSDPSAMEVGSGFLEAFGRLYAVVLNDCVAGSNIPIRFSPCSTNHNLPSAGSYVMPLGMGNAEDPKVGTTLLSLISEDDVIVAGLKKPIRPVSPSVK